MQVLSAFPTKQSHGVELVPSWEGGGLATTLEAMSEPSVTSQGAGTGEAAEELLFFLFLNVAIVIQPALENVG